MGKKLIVGENDFASWCRTHGRTDLLDEWDYEENTCTPESKSYGSHYKAAWKCIRCGNKWNAVLKSRTILGAGCPKCGALKVGVAQSRPDNNDVETFCKTHQLEWLLTEWDYENNEFTPDEICRSSSKYKVAWKCKKCGHQWKSTPNQRIRIVEDDQIRISECPMCLKEKQTSFPEQAVFYYVQMCFPDAINGDKQTVGMELDIYIPSLHTAIEYDGYAWHQNAQKDIRKVQRCINNGIRIIRVREDGCPEIEESDFCKILRVTPNNRESLSNTICALCDFLGIPADVNLSCDEPLIMALYQKGKYENSLGFLYPELSKEFHPTKNGELSVNDINKGSARQVWWKCAVCNHEWLTEVSSRTNGHGCPACSGRVLVPGKNDLETWCKEHNNTELLDEWDYDRNPMLPCEITKKNAFNAFWKCSKCGASYEAKVYNRANGCACPVCAGKKTKAGINDFQTWCIEHGKGHLLAEWDPENELMPSQVTHGSGKRILWVCSLCGHHWSANLDNRKKGRGCPECGKIKRALSNKMRAKKQK